MIRAKVLALLFAIVLTIAARPAFSQLTTGLPPFGSFGGGPIDKVNLSNLNVHLDFPVFSRPGRGQGFSYTLTFDSSLWFISGSPGAEYWGPNSGYGGVTGEWGWGQQAQPSTGQTSYSHYAYTCRDLTPYNKYIFRGYTDGSGTYHQFYATVVDDNTCSSYPLSSTQTLTDGSGLVIYVDATPTMTVTTKSGSVIQVALKDTGNSGSIADSNGAFDNLIWPTCDHLTWPTPGS